MPDTPTCAWARTVTNCGCPGLRDGQPETLVYDIEQGAFLPVDSRKAVQFAYHNGARYLAEETALWKTGTDRKNTDFAAVFGPFRQTSPAVLTGLTILADCVGECTLACAVRTERGDWMPVWASGRLSDGRARIPVPRRARHAVLAARDRQGRRDPAIHRAHSAPRRLGRSVNPKGVIFSWQS